MARPLIIPHATPSLTASAFDFRLYRAGTATPLSAAGLGVEEVRAGVGHYRVTGLPSTYRLTAQVEGEVFAAEMPAPADRADSPADVLLPWREAGHTANSLGLAIVADGADRTADWPLTVTAIADGGGYLISGWPIAEEGRRLALLYSVDGVSGQIEWNEAPARNPQGASDWRYYDYQQLRAVVQTLTTSRMRAVAPGWRGWYDVREFVKEPTPATNAESAACYGKYLLDAPGSGNSINMDATASVIRSGGGFVFDLVFQLSGPSGYDELLGREVRRACEDFTRAGGNPPLLTAIASTTYATTAEGWGYTRIRVPYGAINA